MLAGRSRFHVFTLVVTLLVCGVAAAEPLPVRRVVVFKNGLGFLTRLGPVAVAKSVATIDEIPPAAYGTLWVGFADGSSVTEVVTESASKPGERSTSGVADLLAANPGAHVTLTLRGGGTISGTVVANRPKDEAQPGSVPPHSGERFALAGSEIAPQAGGIMLESGGRFVALSPGDVLTASFASRPRATIATQQRSELLRVRTDGRDGNRELTLSYLTKGIGWTPEYAVELRSDGTVALSMRALLVNDSIDLTGSEVLFAVGYPSFTFAEVPTPLDVRRSLASFFEELRRDRANWNANVLANVMSQSVVYPRGMQEREEGDYDSSTAAGISGEAEQDLFLYSKSGIHLGKGQRAGYPILAATAAYKHVFDWEIGDVANIDAWGYRSSSQPANFADQVWHSLRIDNAGKLPWTTGPAMVTERGTPIAQNTLHYTAPGASTLLRLTVAPDVLAEREEWEASRQSGALQRFGHRYDAVTIEGKLDVTNRRREAITLSIRKSLTGTVSSSSDGGKATRLSTRPSAVNPSSRIDWSISLGAGEQKPVTYKYVVYVRD